MDNLKLFIFFVIFGASFAQLFLNGTSEQEFSIYFQGIKIFDQSPTSSVIFVGIGSTSYKESLGNFIIDDQVVTKISLTNVLIETNSQTNVNVSYSSDSDLGIVVHLALSTSSDVSGDPKLEISVSTVLNEGNYNRLWINFYGDQKEMLFGGGEQYTYFNMKGHYFPIWTSEQGVGRDDGIIANASNVVGGAGGTYYTTYFPQASFLSSRGYTLMVNNHDYMVLDFEDDIINTVFIHSMDMTGSILWASSIKSLVPKMALTFGTQPMLPEWAMTGAILGLEGIAGGTAEIMGRYEQAKIAGVNVSALWIQDWSGTTETSFGHRVYWNWKLNTTYYQGFNLAINQLLNENVRMTVYINPYLIVGCEMYNEAQNLGYLMTDINGSTYQQDFGGFMGATMDLYNVDAKNWYRDQMITNIIGLNIYGWMADFGEYTPMDMYSKAPGGRTQEELHNNFPSLWAQTNKEVIEMSGTVGEVLYFMRSGALGSSKYQIATWAGDQNVDFSYGDGLPSTIVAALSLSVSGIGITHFDIGGFTTQPPILKRSEELLLRSAEYAIFTPIMRTHLGNKPGADWQIYSSNQTLIDFGRLTQIHGRLLPYTKSLVQENTDFGIPVQRPMFYHYENDMTAWMLQYQYMFGEDMIVAPVLQKRQTTVTVYIPEGDGAQWIHLWEGLGNNGGPFTGPSNVTLDAPMGFPCVLYRSDSAFAQLFQSINEDFGESINLIDS